MTTHADLTAKLALLLQEGGQWKVLTSESAARVHLEAVSTAPHPSGLKPRIPDPGFSFETAKALLVVSTNSLPPDTLERLHQVLFAEGTDDWMDYSHFGGTPKPGDELGLSFSSASKGAAALGEVLAALGVSAFTLSRG